MANKESAHFWRRRETQA